MAVVISQDDNEGIRLKNEAWFSKGALINRRLDLHSACQAGGLQLQNERESPQFRPNLNVASQTRLVWSTFTQQEMLAPPPFIT